MAGQESQWTDKVAKAIANIQKKLRQHTPPVVESHQNGLEEAWSALGGTRGGLDTLGSHPFPSLPEDKGSSPTHRSFSLIRAKLHPLSTMNMFTCK
jgi:hypothetical protein